jgi:REP element-mobilizing transposase RayT
VKSSKSKQLLLIPQRSNKRFFGGSLLVGRRKTPRPLNCKEAIHFVLRSQFAVGRNSFRTTKNQNSIQLILKKAARKHGIRVYRQAIQSNHIHLIIKVPSRYAYKCFIAIISGRIASSVMNQMSFKNFLKTLTSSGRGEGLLIKLHAGQAFWEYRPFSRLLHWGKDYKTAYNYLLQNTLEALGFIQYKPRKVNYAYENELETVRRARGKKLSRRARLAEMSGA